MTQLTVDTGVQEYSVNGRGCLRFNPTDPNLYHRFFAAQETLQQLEGELNAELQAAADKNSPEGVLALMAKYDARIKQVLGGVFGEGSRIDEALEGVNLAGVGANGRRVAENFLQALTPILVQGAQESGRIYAGHEQAALAEMQAVRAAREGNDAHA